MAPSVPIAVAPGAPPCLASRTGVNHTVQGAAETTEPESRRRGPSGNTNAADYATIAEIAAAEKMSPAAGPAGIDIVEAILAGWQASSMTLAVLIQDGFLLEDVTSGSG